MRIIVLVFVVCFFVCCKSGSKAVSNAVLENKSLKCPSVGVCNFKVHNNKYLKLQRDAFGNLYPEIIEGNNIVFEFNYLKDENKDVVDGSYREHIILELSKDDLDSELNSFKYVKLVFGRLCFCKGSSGYFKVRTGTLKVTSLPDKKYQLFLTFHVPEVPQIITEIEQVFKLP